MVHTVLLRAATCQHDTLPSVQTPMQWHAARAQRTRQPLTPAPPDPPSSALPAAPGPRALTQVSRGCRRISRGKSGGLPAGGPALGGRWGGRGRAERGRGGGRLAQVRPVQEVQRRQPREDLTAWGTLTLQ